MKNLISSKKLHLIFFFLVNSLMMSCSSFYYSDSVRYRDNEVNIENNLNENLTFVSTRGKRVGNVNYNKGQQYVNTLYLMNFAKKSRFLCFSAKTDTVTIQINKVYRKDALYKNLLASPLFLGLNLIYEPFNKSFYRVKSHNVTIDNLKYNERYLSGKSNYYLVNKKYDSAVLLMKYNPYYSQKDVVYQYVDSVKFVKINKSNDTLEYLSLKPKILSNRYKVLLDSIMTDLRYVNGYIQYNYAKGLSSNDILKFMNKNRNSNAYKNILKWYIEKRFEENKANNNIDSSLSQLIFVYNNQIYKETSKCYFREVDKIIKFNVDLISLALKDKLGNKSYGPDKIISLNKYIYDKAYVELAHKSLYDSMRVMQKNMLYARFVNSLLKINNYDNQLLYFDELKNKDNKNLLGDNLEDYIINNYTAACGLISVNINLSKNYKSSFVKEVKTRYNAKYLLQNINPQKISYLFNKNEEKINKIILTTDNNIQIINDFGYMSNCRNVTFYKEQSKLKLTQYNFINPININENKLDNLSFQYDDQGKETYWNNSIIKIIDTFSYYYNDKDLNHINEILTTINNVAATYKDLLILPDMTIVQNRLIKYKNEFTVIRDNLYAIQKQQIGEGVVLSNGIILKKIALPQNFIFNNIRNNLEYCEWCKSNFKENHVASTKEQINSMLFDISSAVWASICCDAHNRGLKTDILPFSEDKEKIDKFIGWYYQNMGLSEFQLKLALYLPSKGHIAPWSYHKLWSYVDLVPGWAQMYCDPILQEYSNLLNLMKKDWTLDVLLKYQVNKYIYDDDKYCSPRCKHEASRNK